MIVDLVVHHALIAGEILPNRQILEAIPPQLERGGLLEGGPMRDVATEGSVWASASRTLLGLIVYFGSAGESLAAEPAGSIMLDCGVNALYVLHQLEGHPFSLDRLEAILPAWQNEGYSMAELMAASRSLGLTLEGVQLAAGDVPPNRSAIVFLKDAKAGHYVVVRPVGTTRTMVQVIDPPSAPRITDYDRLQKTRSWTGRALVPSSPYLVRSVVPSFLAVGGAIAILVGLLTIWRWPASSIGRSRSSLPDHSGPVQDAS